MLDRMTLARGFRVGPYEILDPIGEGGMGAVYRARDPRLGRDVAIKVLRAEGMADPDPSRGSGSSRATSRDDRRARFQQEARAVSALNHPNIVTVHDIGTEGDVAYLVMELVDGQPLDQLLPPGGMRLSEVLRIGAQVADACARAHANQIVHRDLKPANVMLQRDGRVKVLDFGLAKLFEAPGADNARTMVTRTMAGTILGTAAYMSPEQAEGKPLDGRSDIFSFGVMLYELCTGKRPFQGDSHASVLAEVLKQEPPPPGDLRADLPPELGRLIMRCLRKDPERRVQSMADLKVALEELREEADSGSLTSQVRAGVPVPSSMPATTTTTAAVTTRRRPWQAVAAGALALTAILGGFYAWRSRAPAPARVDATVQPVPLTSYPGIERPGNFSPDGSQLVFSWDGDRQDNFDIYVKLIGPGPPLRVTTDPAPDFGPRWSPDGRTVAFVRWVDRETVAVMLVPPLGGQERKVAQFQTRVVLGAQLTSLCWSTDSKYLFVSGGQGANEPNHIYRVAIDSGEITRLASVEGIGDGYTSLDLSPDGKTLATVRLDSSGSRRLELIALSSAFDREGSTELKALGANVGGARWTTDGRQLVYAVSVNNPLPLYRYALEGGEPTPMTWVGAGAWSPAIARQGNRLVFARDFRDTNIWRVTLDPGGAAAGPPAQLASSSFREVFPQYSPDGRRLAFFSNRGGSVQVWTSEVDGSKAVPLTAMHAMATTGSPRWSPDGQRIAFDSNASGSYQIYEISADGGQPRALTSGASSNFIASWSPDGRWIYFSSDRSGRLEVWRMPAGGGEPERVTREGGQASTVTPDGQWVYFTKKDGADGLWRIPAGGGAESRVLERVFRYNFVPTDKGIYYVAPVSADRTSSVNFLDFKAGETRQIVPLDRIPDLGLALSPDGRSLLFTTIDYLGTDLMLVEGFR